MSEDNRPAKTYRSGSCSAAIWQNRGDQDGQSVTHYSVTMQRRYRDKDGNWKDTASWYSSHLPQLIVLAVRCMWWMASHEETNTDVSAPAEA